MILCGELLRLYSFSKKNKQTTLAVIKRQNSLHYLDFLTSESLKSQESIENAFSKYLNYLRKTISWKYHSLWRLISEQQVVTIRFTGGLPEWYMGELGRELLIKVGDASIGRAVATKQPVTINVAEEDPRFTNLKTYGTRAQYRSLSCYPLVGKHRTLGGFCAYGKDINMFTLHDIKFLLTCANLYAIVVENMLFDKYLFLRTHHTKDRP